MTQQDQPSLASDLPESVIQSAHLHAMLFNTEDAMNTKLELIREEIESGRYEVNNKHIAAKLLEFAPLTACPEMVDA